MKKKLSDENAQRNTIIWGCKWEDKKGREREREKNPRWQLVIVDKDWPCINEKIDFIWICSIEKKKNFPDFLLHLTITMEFN